MLPHFSRPGFSPTSSTCCGQMCWALKTSARIYKALSLQVTIDGKQATGQGSNKKEAKSNAAQAMLDLLDGKTSSSSASRKASSSSMSTSSGSLSTAVSRQPLAGTPAVQRQASLVTRVFFYPLHTIKND